VIVGFQMLDLLNPLAQGSIGGKPGRLPQRLLKRGQYLRRERERLSNRNI